jgi:hypothetical protein
MAWDIGLTISITIDGGMLKMTPIDHLEGILSISACSWGMYSLYISFRIKRFIVKRYEKETDLLNTNFFRNHVPFARYLPFFFSTAIYAGHLMMCRWGWRYFQSKKVFKDIDDPERITCHFTQREVSQVKKHGISLLIVMMHVIAYYVLKLLWPDVFSL